MASPSPSSAHRAEELPNALIAQLMTSPGANDYRVPKWAAKSGADWLIKQVAINKKTVDSDKRTTGWMGASPTLTPIAFLIKDKLTALWGETFASHVFGVCGRRDTQSQGAMIAHSLTNIILLVLKFHRVGIKRTSVLVNQLLASFKSKGNYLGNPLHLAAVLALMNFEERVEAAIVADFPPDKVDGVRAKLALPDAFLKLVAYFRSRTPFQGEHRGAGLDLFNRTAEFFTTYLGKETADTVIQFVTRDALTVNYIALSRMALSDNVAQRGLASYLIDRCPNGMCRKSGINPVKVDGLSDDVASVIHFLTNAQSTFNPEHVLSAIDTDAGVMKSKAFKAPTYRVKVAKGQKGKKEQPAKGPTKRKTSEATGLETPDTPDTPETSTTPTVEARTPNGSISPSKVVDTTIEAPPTKKSKSTKPSEEEKVNDSPTDVIVAYMTTTTEAPPPTKALLDYVKGIGRGHRAVGSLFTFLTTDFQKPVVRSLPVTSMEGLTQEEKETFEDIIGSDEHNVVDGNDAPLFA